MTGQRVHARAGAHRAAVLGSPIQHSLSPVLHRAAYAALGLDWTYEAIEVADDGLAAFIASCDSSWAGLSLTMPLKLAAAPLVDQLSADATATGVVNTIVFTDAGLVGANTDVDGFVSAIRSAGLDGLDTVVVIGSGATARSAVLAATSLGAGRVHIAARSRAGREAVATFAESIGIAASAAGLGEPTDAELVISTVPSSALEPYASSWAASSTAPLFDVIYDPWPTTMSQACAASGRLVLDGIDLLVHQAVGQVELMTGSVVAPEVMDRAGRAALRMRSQAT